MVTSNTFKPYLLSPMFTCGNGNINPLAHLNANFTNIIYCLQTCSPHAYSLYTAYLMLNNNQSIKKLILSIIHVDKYLKIVTRVSPGYH